LKRRFQRVEVVGVKNGGQGGAVDRAFGGHCLTGNILGVRHLFDKHNYLHFWLLAGIIPFLRHLSRVCQSENKGWCQAPFLRVSGTFFPFFSLFCLFFRRHVYNKNYRDNYAYYYAAKYREKTADSIPGKNRK